jgi:sporulation protein YlmC with PRC-barrel domain
MPYVNELIGTLVVAADGELGKVKDIYFEDKEWRVQYLVVDTGSWPFGESVLISPLDTALYLAEQKVLMSALTKAELKRISEDEDPRPITKRNTSLLYSHRAWPAFGRAGNGYPTLGMMKAGSGLANVAEFSVKRRRHTLSFKPIVNYDIHNSDGRLGLLKDLMMDLEKWSLPYLLFDDTSTSDRERVIIANDRVISFDSRQSLLNISISQAQFQASPKINPVFFLPMGRCNGVSQ